MAQAKDIMIRDLVTIKESTKIIEAITIMLANKISVLPVVDDNIKLLGILAEKDLLELAFFECTDDETVSDYMTRDVITLDENTELLEVCECLIKKNLKRIPILSNEKLAGIISRKDMLKYILAL
ncbi:MAG: CBS domain-containing protein [Spirochaetes bacterium]|nr:CBS domain-containing protein [Spirochaetota bacterium]